MKIVNIFCIAAMVAIMVGWQQQFNANSTRTTKTGSLHDKRYLAGGLGEGV